MRATRAYFAALGTAGAMVVGAALGFVLASAVVAFHGWPNADGLGTPTRIVFSAPARSETPVARRLAVLMDTSRVAGIRVAPRTPVTVVLSARRPGGVADDGTGSATRASVGHRAHTRRRPAPWGRASVRRPGASPGASAGF